MSRRAPEWFGGGGDRRNSKDKKSSSSLNNSNRSSSSSNRKRSSSSGGGGDREASSKSNGKKDHRRTSSRKRSSGSSSKHRRKKSQESISSGSAENAISTTTQPSTVASDNATSVVPFIESVSDNRGSSNDADKGQGQSPSADKDQGKKPTSTPKPLVQQQVPPPSTQPSNDSTTATDTTTTSAEPTQSSTRALSSSGDKKSFMSAVADSLFGKLRSSSHDKSNDKSNNPETSQSTSVLSPPPPSNTDYQSIMEGGTPRISNHKADHLTQQTLDSHSSFVPSPSHTRTVSEPIQHSFTDLGGMSQSYLTDQYQLESHSSFPQPNPHSGKRQYYGLPTVDSDDPLTYSDDDTTVHHQPPYPKHMFENGQRSLSLHASDEPLTHHGYHHQRSKSSMPNTSSLYPSYVTQEHQNQEIYQLREQQQMMAMQHQTQHYRPLSPQKQRHHSPARTHHRAATSIISNKSTNGLSNGHIPSYGAVSTPPPPSNDMYMSEDGSMTSVQSNSSLSQYDRFFFQGPLIPNRPIEEGKQPSIAEEVNGGGGETTSLLSSVIHSQGTAASTSSPPTTSSKQAKDSAPTIATTTTATNEMHHVDSAEFPKGLMQAMEQRSSSSSNSSPSPQHPPPLHSVQVYDRSFRTETTAASTATPNRDNYGANVQKLSQYQKREIRKLRKRKEKAERVEDRVQAIVFPSASRKAHDIFFGLLFLLQFAGISYIALRYGKLAILQNLSSDDDDDDGNFNGISAISETGFDDPFSSGTPSIPTTPTSPLSIWAQDIHVDFANAFQLSCIAAIQSTFLSALALGMMMILSTGLIQVFLCFTVILCFLFGAIGLILSPYNVIPVLGIVALLLSLSYCIVVWDTIPFSAVNLNTALVGIQSSAEIFLVAFWMMIVAFFWTIEWAVAFLGIYDSYLTKDSADNVLNNTTWTGWAIYAGMLASFFWTLFVITNFVQVTVAGVIGEWWSSPESSKSCCNSVIFSQIWKAMTCSFGSICLGSLILTPAQFLQIILTNFSTSCSSYPQSYQYMVNSDSVRDLSSSLRDVSIHKDHLSVMSDVSDRSSNSAFSCILNSCNEFGFIYIGVYGENFITASRKAAAVFKARDWLGAVSNRLIPHVLFMTSVIIALCTGFFAFLVEEFDGFNFTNFRKPTSTAFLIGCCVGLVMSHVCMKVVGSAVKTVLVCFSIAPYAFQQNHPELSNELRSSWGVDFLDDFLGQFDQYNSGEFV